MTRRLSDEEKTLWTSVARSIKPLRPTKPSIKPGVKAVRSGAKPAPAPAAPRHEPAAKSPPLAPFDRRLKQRVARGREGIDARH